MKTSHRFQVSPDKLWDKLSDFGAMAAWSPDLAMSAQLQGRGVDVGAVRELTFAKPRGGITSIRERITDCGPGWFQYELVNGFGPYRQAGSRWTVQAQEPGCRLMVESFVRGGPLWAVMVLPLVMIRLRFGLRRALKQLATSLGDERAT